MSERSDLVRKPHRGTLYIRNVNTKIKCQFKAACARRNLSMSLVIERFMEKFAADKYIYTNIPDMGAELPVPSFEEEEPK